MQAHQTALPACAASAVMLQVFAAQDKNRHLDQKVEQLQSFLQEQAASNKQARVIVLSSGVPQFCCFKIAIVTGFAIQASIMELTRERGELDMRAMRAENQLRQCQHSKQNAELGSDMLQKDVASLQQQLAGKSEAIRTHWTESNAKVHNNPNHTLQDSTTAIVRPCFTTCEARIPQYASVTAMQCMTFHELFRCGRSMIWSDSFASQAINFSCLRLRISSCNSKGIAYQTNYGRRSRKIRRRKHTCSSAKPCLRKNPTPYTQLCQGTRRREHLWSMINNLCTPLCRNSPERQRYLPWSHAVPKCFNRMTLA